MSLYIFSQISRIDAMQKKIFNLHNLRNQQKKKKQKIGRNVQAISIRTVSIFELLTREFIMLQILRIFRITNIL